ncbi:MAG: hypothetical protein WC456_03855 [Patescibacteria group bacterium]
MRPENNAEYVEDWANENTQCHRCTSFSVENGAGYCREAQGEVPETAHCDYFQARD